MVSFVAAECTSRLDIVFVLDASGSVEAKFELAMKLARRIIEGLNFAGSRTRVGVMTYADDVTIRFHLDTYNSRDEVLNAIAFTQDRGKTNTAGALSEMETNMFTSSHGDRPGDDNYAVVITDGNSNVQRINTIPAAEDARQAGIKIFAVGIGDNGSVDRSEINGIANNPDSDFAHLMATEEELEVVADTILTKICES